MKILIVDDEKPARDRMRRLIDNLSDFSVIAEAQNGQDALQQCEQHHPDIVLMDIRMPGMDGLEAASLLSRQSTPPAIIFTTAFADHALEAFESHAVDYLLKPVKLERLREALNSCSQLNRAQLQDTLNEVINDDERQHICARVRGNLVLISLEDIFYFRAEQKYVTVRHTGGEVLIEEPLKTLEQEFARDFHRVHRNALVRLDKVAGMKNNPEGHQIFFHEIEDRLEISRRHLSGVRKLLKNL
jgi:two-component system, LytTR family, response regulator AlgR